MPCQRNGCDPQVGYSAEEIDFLVAWVVPEDAWYCDSGGGIRAAQTFVAVSAGGACGTV